MLKPSLQDLVFGKTIPHPKQNDPVSFFTHVQRNLVPEVRLEVQTFYGSLDCIEAQYPGLDYTYGPHRRRLSRYPWHRRLFRTFDELRLTADEILSLCQWEGTRSAKERYEAETKRLIPDTTADCVEAAPAGTGPRAQVYGPHAADGGAVAGTITQKHTSEDDVDADQSDEDEISASIGVQLNQQLQAAVEARSRGDLVSIDAQWEQWMKEALERSDFDHDTFLQAIRDGQTLPPAGSSTGGMTTDGHESTEVAAISSALHMSQPQITQRYSDLRETLRHLQSANNQLSAENAALAMFLNRSQPETAR